MLKLKIVLTRDVHTSINLSVPPWEIPVLEAIHGAEPGIIEVTGEEYSDTPELEPEQEYRRLEQRYGLIPETPTPYVVQIFGPGRQGVARLAERMAEAAARARKLEPREELVDAPPAARKASAKGARQRSAA